MRQLMFKEVELPPVDDWPHTTCITCHRSLINGLYTPLELQQPSPRCRKCTGEINGRAKKNAVLAGK
jgi:hypothetical protein